MYLVEQVKIRFIMSGSQRKLGVTTVFFPRGLDLRLKHFSNEKFKKIFDIFLCYGKFDKKLIQKNLKIQIIL